MQDFLLQFGHVRAQAFVVYLGLVEMSCDTVLHLDQVVVCHLGRDSASIKIVNAFLHISGVIEIANLIQRSI